MHFSKQLVVTALFLVVMALVTRPTRAQDGYRLDFESVQSTDQLENWYVGGKGYKVSIDTAEAHSGQKSLRMSWKEEGQFGVATRSFPAANARGLAVRLTGYIKTDSVQSGYAGFWMRVDGGERKTLAFDNMAGRGPRGTTSWREYQITLPVDSAATRIVYGALMPGRGTAWFDDLHLQFFEPPPLVVEKPRPLAGRSLSNVVAFTRLLGYVHHFHPSDEAQSVNWQVEAVEGIRAVTDAESPSELAHRLDSLFQPVAPTVQVVPTEKGFRPPSSLYPSSARESLRTVRWQHEGYGAGRDPGNAYSSERVFSALPEGTTPRSYYEDDMFFTEELPGGVRVRVPLVLFADSTGTFPERTKLDSDQTSAFLTAKDRGTRLAGVALAWNVLQHFYPYFDVVGGNWTEELRTALQAAAMDSSEAEFKRTLERMTAALQDGHVNVIGPGGPANTHALPLLWDWVQGELVVTRVDSTAEVPLRPGNVIQEINGVPAEDTLRRMEAYISGATAGWKRMKSLRDLRRGPEGKPLTLRVKTSSETMTVEVPYSLSRRRALAEPRPAPITELRPGIWYIDLTEATTAAFNDTLPALDEAEGIIFDMRGYPGDMRPVFLQHLITEPVESAQWLIPRASRPDRQNLSFKKGERWNLEPRKPHLDAEIAFLTDSRAISYAESLMGIVEAYELGEIVGAPTAGTNGNVNNIRLPGSYRITFTGMKVLKHDGSRHHGVGIQPTVPVRRTRQGIRRGQDEVLEHALELVQP